MRSERERLTARSYATTLITDCFTSPGKASSDDVRRKSDGFFVAVSRHCSVTDKIHMLGWSESTLRSTN